MPNSASKPSHSASQPSHSASQPSHSASQPRPLPAKTLLNRLKKAYPKLHFVSGDRFLFHPPDTIFYSAPQLLEPTGYLLLLHELGHALLPTYDYRNDIELLAIEARAWAEAKRLCQRYRLPYDENFAEDRLDSYRDWLHCNSLCKNCRVNAYQDRHGLYHCPLCGASWPNRFPPQ